VADPVKPETCRSWRVRSCSGVSVMLMVIRRPGSVLGSTRPAYRMWLGPGKTTGRPTRAKGVSEQSGRSSRSGTGRWPSSRTLRSSLRRGTRYELSERITPGPSRPSEGGGAKECSQDPLRRWRYRHSGVRPQGLLGYFERDPESLDALPACGFLQSFGHCFTSTLCNQFLDFFWFRRNPRNVLG
jgi:hypothetical protein